MSDTDLIYCDCSGLYQLRHHYQHIKTAMHKRYENCPDSTKKIFSILNKTRMKEAGIKSPQIFDLPPIQKSTKRRLTKKEKLNDEILAYIKNMF